MDRREQAALRNWHRMCAQHSPTPWWQRANVPAAFKGKSLDTYDAVDHGDVDAWRTAKAWAKDMERNISEGLGLILRGRPGTGKTHLGVALLREVARTKRYGYYWLSAWDFNKLSFDLLDLDPESHEDQQLAVLYNGLHWGFDVLVVDDLGNEYRRNEVDAFAKRKMSEMLRERGSAGLTTIITTNFTDEQLLAFYGESFVSYLREVCREVAVDCPDYRSVLHGAR